MAGTIPIILETGPQSRHLSPTSGAALAPLNTTMQSATLKNLNNSYH